MYYPQEFKHLTEEKITQAVKKEGFRPLKLRNAPGARYPQHQHPEEKLLVFLEGTMEVTVEHHVYHCRVGDKLTIPGNKVHSAVAGPHGCTFLWAEKG